MASHVYVVDPTAKRTQIKVTPGTYLRDVLDEACGKLRLNSEQYSLKYNNKPLDLTRPIRLSGLPNAAKLQLTQSSRSPSVVSVALQLPESLGGSRFSGKFRSSTSLWLILRAYESGNVPNADPSKPLPKNINITQRAVPEDIGAGAGRLCYEQPCLHMIGQDYTTFTDLQKTLAQRGLNDGSVLIRLSFKNSGRPLDEAMTEIT
ncbi:hypothetical protein LTR66_013985, partial [Elasticomyces elasticus]